MIDFEQIPDNAIGLRLCKMKGDELVNAECVIFKRGRAGVELTLRRAALAGTVGPIGETGDYWADFISDEYGTWVDTVALDRDTWNALKRFWLRCKLDTQS
ncbi:MAG: hypothetical protein AAF354_07365 [Pseudomonadota bacterium]